MSYITMLKSLNDMQILTSKKPYFSFNHFLYNFFLDRNLWSELKYQTINNAEYRNVKGQKYRNHTILMYMMEWRKFKIQQFISTLKVLIPNSKHLKLIIAYESRNYVFHFWSSIEEFPLKNNFCKNIVKRHYFLKTSKFQLSSIKYSRQHL